jgi:hypothetical protein
LAQASDGDVEFAGQGLERLAAQQAGDDGQLAPGGEAALRPAPPEGAPASAVWAHAGAPSGLSLRI